MPDDDDDTSPRAYASPACYMHEVDPAYFGLAPPAPQPGAELVRWRKAERERLIAARLALGAGTRAAHTREIVDGLTALVEARPDLIVSAYWPFRGEPDLRPWLRSLRDRGLRVALPVVVAKKTPMIFRLWQQGGRLEHGVWNIPAPAEGEPVQPDVVIAPVVGFDDGCYRLGYGGGFFDRTLATLPAATIAIGVGYAQARMPTIHPQPFDIPMRHIVTEGGTLTR